MMAAKNYIKILLIIAILGLLGFYLDYKFAKHRNDITSVYYPKWTIFVIDSGTSPPGNDQSSDLPETFDYSAPPETPTQLDTLQDCRMKATMYMKDFNSKENRPDFKYHFFYCGLNCRLSEKSIKNLNESSDFAPGQPTLLSEYRCDKIDRGHID